VKHDRWERLKEVFLEALQHPAAERRAWVANACAGDEELQGEAEALLDAHDSDPGFLEDPAQIDPEDLQTVGAEAPGTSLAPGTVVGDSQYRIIGELGRGGMGIVYLAQDLRLPRRVAMKSLSASAANDAGRLERFKREAWAAAKITHPAVATIYAFEDLGGHPFIVSEYVRGKTLSSELQQGALEPWRARRIAIEIARALCAAHEEGVVHRDLKPDNVLLTEDGGVKVVDFGIAQLESAAESGLTREGTWVGTPAYMAPEQKEGGVVDARADIYSFGVVLSEMLTGRHPLTARPPSASSRPGSTPSGASGASTSRENAPLSGALGAIVKRSLQLDPSERYGSARELLVELERVEVPAVAGSDESASARWWWEFHQAATATIYWMMVATAWFALFAAQLGGQNVARLVFVVLLASVIVSANLRLNLWFTSRFLPVQLDRMRRQRRWWIRAGDWGLVLSMMSGGILIVEERQDWSFVLFACGIAAAIASTLIEPVTERGAFGANDVRRI
jgi:hypothetical protein